MEWNAKRFSSRYFKIKKKLFPVVNNELELVAVIHLDDVRGLIFNHDQYDNVTIKEIMTTPKGTLELRENLQSVLTKFDTSNMWNIPVRIVKKNAGFLSKSSILSKYRSALLKSM